MVKLNPRDFKSRPREAETMPYKDMYYIQDITQYEYLICDDKYINRKL